MRKILLLIAIATTSVSLMAQTPAAANQQSQSAQQTVQNDKAKVVNGKQQIEASKRLTANQKEVLDADYDHAKSEYQKNMKALNANKNLSPAEYKAQKEKINSQYNAYKTRYTAQRKQLNNAVKDNKQAVADGEITPEERAKMKANQDAAVEKYKQDKKANNRNKQNQRKP